MVSASTKAEGYCLALRFCAADEVARMERLMVLQVRRHFERFAGMKPKAIREQLNFDVFAIDNPPNPNGYPRWLGESVWYK